MTQSAYDDIIKEFPNFSTKLKRKVWWHRVIDIFLKIISLGFNRAYLTNYSTLIGNTLYVSDDWYKMGINYKNVSLSHEVIHLRQSMNFGNFLFSVLYLFVPVPFVFSYFRMRFEKEAYEGTLWATYRYLGRDALCSDHLKEMVVSQFVTSAYLWMWPFRKSIEKWYDSIVEKILEKDPLI